MWFYMDQMEQENTNTQSHKVISKIIMRWKLFILSISNSRRLEMMAKRWWFLKLVLIEFLLFETCPEYEVNSDPICKNQIFLYCWFLEKPYKLRHTYRNTSHKRLNFQTQIAAECLLTFQFQISIDIWLFIRIFVDIFK